MRPCIAASGLLVCILAGIAPTLTLGEPPVTDSDAAPFVTHPGYQRRGDAIYLFQAATDEQLKGLRNEAGVKSIGWGGMYSGAEGPLIMDAGLANLSGLHELTRIELGFWGFAPYPINFITDDGLKHLRGLTQLQGLGLNGHRIVGPGLENIAGMRQLKYLYLSCRPLTNVGLQHLRGLTELESLHIAGNAITSNGLKNLAGMTNMKDLSIACPGVLDPGMKVIGGFKKLQTLSLYAEVTDRGIAELANLTELKSLTLHAHVTDEGLRHLAGLKNLETLSLYGTQVTGEGLKHLSELTKLQTLNLGRTAVTDEGLQQLKNLPSLVTLDLNWTRVGSDGLEAIAALPNLQKLIMYGATLTGSEVDQQGRLRKLKSWDLQSRQTHFWPDDPAEAGVPRLDWVRTTDPDQVAATEPGAPDTSLHVVEKTMPPTTLQRAGRIHYLGFSPDSRRLISGCHGSNLNVHDVTTGQLLLGHDPRVYRGHPAALFPDGKRLAVLDSGKAHLLDTETFVKLEDIDPQKAGIHHIAVAPDGNTMALVLNWDSVLIWDIAQRKSIMSLGPPAGSHHEPDSIKSMQFIGGGKFLAILNSKLKVWELSTGKLVAMSSQEFGSDPLGVSADGKQLLVRSGGGLRIWDPVSKATDVLYIPGNVYEPWEVAFAADLSLGASADQHDAITVWDARRERILLKLIGRAPEEGRGRDLRMMAFSPDGKLLAAGFDDGRIDIWRLR